jgi:hypothetical protein
MIEKKLKNILEISISIIAGFIAAITINKHLWEDCIYLVLFSFFMYLSVRFFKERSLKKLFFTTLFFGVLFAAKLLSLSVMLNAT